MRLRSVIALVASTTLTGSLIQALPWASPVRASSTCPVAVAPTTGTGTSADPWELASPGNVQWLRDTGSKSAHYELTANISMGGCTWTSGISAFSGTFAGQGFMINGLSISSGDANVGFFRAITSTAVISNLGLTNITVVSTFNPSATFTFLNGYVGALVGDSTGQVEGSFATGSVTARYTGPIENSDATYVGGLVGRADQSPAIAGSWFAGQGAGGGYSGGLVGYLRGATLSGSSSSGNVSGAYSGGLVGRTDAVGVRAVVQESFSSMDASGDYAGGLVGRLAGANVLRSLSTGNAAGNTAAGGIAATIDSTISLFDTMSTGNVTVSRSSSFCHAGGLLGRSNVSNPTLTVARSFALGTVSNTSGHNCNGPTYIGPLMSSIIPSGKITQAAFYLNEVPSGNNTAGTKVTQAQLQDISTYNTATPAWTNTSSARFPIATVTSCSDASNTHWSLCPSTDPYLSSIGLLSAPAAPTSVSGSGIDGGVALTWSAPSSTGDAPIVGYAIESSTDDTNWTPAVSNTRTPVTAADITGLNDATTYYFRVKAITGEGVSSASTSSGPVVAGALPSPPLNVAVSGVRSTEVDLRWNPPQTSGASAIQDYEIELSIGNSGTWSVYSDTVSTATNITITGLVNGGVYRFRVSAKNSLGWSLPSDPTEEQYVGDVPETPTNVRIGGWSRTGTVIGWDTPSAGSTPITGYQIEYSSNGGASWTTSPTTYAANATSGAVENLVENQEYDFRVIALNAVGPSAPSSSITHVVGLLPSSPRNVTAAAVDSNRINVRWDPPSDPGSSPVSSYRIDYSDDGGRTWTTRVSTWPSTDGTNAALGSWPGGKTYTFRVYATNNSGENPTPGQGGSVVMGTAPSAPTRPAATTGDRSVELTWLAPDTSNTFPVTGYAIQRSTDSGASWNTIVSNTASTRTTFTDTGLINGLGYNYRVAAINAEGTSVFSQLSAEVTPVSSSDFVSTWSIANNGDSITLPLSSAAGTIYNFTVAWGDGTSDTITAASGLPVTHTYASAGTYTVRISGTMRGWSFAQVSTSAEAITDISQWGNFAPASGITGVFRGAANLDVSATDAPDLSFTTTLADFFRDASSLTTPDLTRWDTSGISSMDGMFSGASSFNSSIATWDTSRVVDFDNFLRGAVAFERDLGSLDVTSVGFASGFLAGVELSTANYQALLVGWAAQDVRTGVNFDGGSSTWAVDSASGNARAVLIGTHGWTIVDGGGTPGAPVITSTTPTSGAIGLNWTAPANDGDRTITDYEYSLDGVTWTSFNSSATSGSISGLIDGTTYSIRVRAVNSVGTGVASSPVNESPASAQPSAPSSITVTRGDQQLTFDFVVTYNGGSDITAVEFSLDNGVNWTAVTSWSASGSALSATITGLTNGTEYSLKLRVSNGSQTSPSSPSVTGTPATAPAQPTITVTTGPGSITVDANGTQNTGGLPIDYYEYRIESGTWTRAASLPFTIADLAPGTYTLDVRAVSAAGTSDLASATRSVTVEAPGPVVGLVLMPGDSQISVSWQPADGNVTDYEISLGSGWQSLGSTATSTTLTDLTNGMLYSIQIRAMNFTVAGPESDLEQATPGVPGAVSELNATAGKESITLTWAAPDAGASFITAYEFSLDFGSTWVTTGSSATRYEITGLTAGVNVTVTLRAGNRFGFGLPSSGVSATPLPQGGGESAGLPSAPEEFTIVPSSTSAVLSWEPPSDAGATPVTGYEIGYYLANNPVRPTNISITGGNVRTYTITGLTAGEEYQFLLSAVNDAGIGPTASANVTVGDLPGAPTNLTAEPGNGSVTLSWTAASSGTSPIFDYEYTINDGIDWTPFAPTGTTGTVTDLMNGTDYRFQVRALNASGTGPASDSVVQRAGVPRAPSNLQTTVEPEAVEVQWNAPDTFGLGVTGYEITVSEISSRSITMRSMAIPVLTPGSGSYVTTSTSYTITGLSPTGSYTISVRAINNYGAGLPATTSIGLQPDDSEDPWVGPAPHVQQFGAPVNADADMCAALAPADLNWSGVPSGGWGVSWAQWVNDGKGGAVCTRTLMYDRWKAKWVLAA